tara:strand:- start:155 stop:1189 length:1035 start_codon:yes stop_codon:yes gene_type:complete
MEDLKPTILKKIATVVVATKSYIDPLEVCLRRLKTALDYASKGIEHKLIIVTDQESKEYIEKISVVFNTDVIAIDLEESGEHYKKDRQILIATLQSVGFDAARDWGCDYLWSVEADVLVPHNALSISLHMLEFDDGYYDVSFVTYPSQGGGSFLGGYGSYTNPIAEDFLPEERKLPSKLKTLLDACKKRLENKNLTQEEADREMKRLGRINEKVRSCPPKGNVFELNAKAWRRRGWLDNSHIGVGKGAVIETDWTGLGCTLMSKKAAALAHFDGYDGGGTQDLYLNWRKWHPEGLRFCCITHTVCDHIVRDKDKGLVVLKSYHETQGEARGHLRFNRTPFNKFI